TGGTARGLSLQLVHLGQGTLAAPFYPVEPTHGRLSFLPTTKADHGSALPKQADHGSALQFVQEGYPEGFGEDGLDRDGMEARGGERGGLDRVLFGHQHGEVAAEVEVVGGVAVVVGEGVGDDGDAEGAQHFEEAFGVADAGDGVDALAGVVVEGDGASALEGGGGAGAEVHGPFAEAHPGL